MQALSAAAARPAVGPPQRARLCGSRRLAQTTADRAAVLQQRCAHRRQAVVAAARSGGGSGGAVALPQDAFEKLQACEGVYLAGTTQPVRVTDLWSEGERAVVVWGRSMLAVRLRRDLLPALRDRGVRLYMVSIGTAERGVAFCEKTGFPPELLLCDPTNSTYSGLDFRKGIRETFFSPATPLAMWERIKAGKMGDLKQVLSVWTKQELWIPPRQDQAFQQGGAVVFAGRRLLFAHYDEATSAHVDFEALLAAATQEL